MLSLLEHFEIIYKMRIGGITSRSNSLDEEQMFFVPSLLSPLPEGQAHPSINYWRRIIPEYVRSAMKLLKK